VILVVKATPHHDYLWKKVFAPWPKAGPAERYNRPDLAVSGVCHGRLTAPA
jgi:hypothetical protein